jgi:hypothetical protein
VSLKHTLQRIVEVDNELSGLSKREVVSISDVNNFRELKAERRILVGAIHAAARYWRDQQT